MTPPRTKKQSREAAQRGMELRELREKFHLTQAEMGLLLQIYGSETTRKQTVWRYESGSCPPWALRLAQLELGAVKPRGVPV